MHFGAYFDLFALCTYHIFSAYDSGMYNVNIKFLGTRTTVRYTGHDNNWPPHRASDWCTRKRMHKCCTRWNRFFVFTNNVINSFLTYLNFEFKKKKRLIANNKPSVSMNFGFRRSPRQKYHGLLPECNDGQWKWHYM